MLAVLQRLSPMCRGPSPKQVYFLMAAMHSNHRPIHPCC